MDTKRLREILIELGNIGIKGSLIPNDYYNGKIDQAIKEIQELSCDCHIIRDSAVKRVVEQQKIIAELEGKLSTPRLTEELEKAVEHRTSILHDLLKDACDDDTEIRTMAKEVLTEYEVEGDSYGVPCLTDVVRLIVDKAKPRLMEECPRCRGEWGTLGEMCSLCNGTGKKPSVREEGSKE